MACKEKIAADNHGFLSVAVSVALASREFGGLVRETLHGRQEFGQYGIETRAYSGYIRVFIETGEYRLGEVLQAICDGVFGQVAMKIYSSVSGVLNDQALVEMMGLRFSFTITKYERDQDHSFVLVDDPLSLPSDERLGRLVELRIS